MNVENNVESTGSRRSAVCCRPENQVQSRNWCVILDAQPNVLLHYYFNIFDFKLHWKTL